jgi:hypothetical protein
MPNSDTDRKSHRTGFIGCQFTCLFSYFSLAMAIHLLKDRCATHRVRGKKPQSIQLHPSSLQKIIVSVFAAEASGLSRKPNAIAQKAPHTRHDDLPPVVARFRVLSKAAK